MVAILFTDNSATHELLPVLHNYNNTSHAIAYLYHKYNAETKQRIPVNG